MRILSLNIAILRSLLLRRGAPPHACTRNLRLLGFSVTPIPSCGSRRDFEPDSRIPISTIMISIIVRTDCPATLAHRKAGPFSSAQGRPLGVMAVLSRHHHLDTFRQRE